MERFILDDEWRSKAACKGLDTALFFPSSEEETAAAKRVCATCPVREPCLEFALVTRQDDGIWGGTDEVERQRILRGRSYVRKPLNRPTGY